MRVQHFIDLLTHSDIYVIPHLQLVVKRNKDAQLRHEVLLMSLTYAQYVTDLADMIATSPTDADFVHIRLVLFSSHRAIIDHDLAPGIIVNATV